MATEPVLPFTADISRRSHPPAEAEGASADRPAVGRRSVGLSIVLGRAWVKKLLFLSADLVALVTSHRVAEALVERWMTLPSALLTPGYYYLFYAPFITMMLYLLGGYKCPDLRRPEKEFELTFKGASYSFVALACANFVLFKSLAFSRYLTAGWYVLALLFLLVARFSVRAFYGALWRRGLARQKALFVGSPGLLAGIGQQLAIQRYQGYDLIGAVVESGDFSAVDRFESGVPVLGSVQDWEAIADAEGTRLVLIRLAESPAGDFERVHRIICRCREKGIGVEVYSSLFASCGLRFERDEFSGCLRLHSPSQASLAAQRFAKSALDIVIGLLGSLGALLLIPVVGLFLKLEDGGPVFHRREYLGMDGRVHHFLKFRTMVQNAEQILESDAALKVEFESMFKLKRDPRVLRCGRFLRRYSLDEFPQFFSILTRQLTFVGPRAITPAARIRYGDLASKLLSMKPGLTGFWQVMGRQTTTFEEKVQMDMFYIDHWSIWLDLVIVAKTVWQVLRAEGAY